MKNIFAIRRRGLLRKADAVRLPIVKAGLSLLEGTQHLQLDQAEQIAALMDLVPSGIYTPELIRHHRMNYQLVMNAWLRYNRYPGLDSRELAIVEDLEEAIIKYGCEKWRLGLVE